MEREPRRELRPEIQALRAVAVLAVVIYHLWPERLTGGYVGVDVFFVISGFLITGHLWREFESQGSVHLPAFWVRRARRLLPSALLVLLLTVAAVVLLVPFSYWRQFLGETVAATFYFENWALAASAVNYLAAENGASLVQHYWSLSVEEQFYIVWPLLLLGIAAFGRSIRIRPKLTVTIGMAAVTTASLAWSVLQTQSDPGIAYFSTATRVWEFGAGALLSLTSIRLPPQMRTAGSIAGVVAIAAAVMLFQDSTPFPGVAAALPVAGTALVIAAGTPPTWWSAVLTFRPMQFIGTISYSLYLWHWPPIAVALILVDELGAPLKAAILAFSVGAAWLTYRFVERPLRARAVRRAAPTLVAAAVGMGVVAALAAAPLMTLRPADETSVSAEPFADATELNASIEDADATAIRPSDILGPAAGPVPEWVRDGCLDVGEENRDRCVYGSPDAPHVAAVIGDSIGASWLPALRGALDSDEWRIQVLTLGQCPVADVSIVRNDGNTEFVDLCNAHRDWALQTIVEMHPDLVIASQSSSAVNYLASGATGATAIAEWREGLAQEFEALAQIDAPVVILGRPEFGQRPAGECVGMFVEVRPCEGRFPEVSEFASIERETAQAAGLIWLSTRQWVCSPTDDCPPIIDGSPVTADGSHLTWEFAHRLSEVLADSLSSNDEISALPGVG